MKPKTKTNAFEQMFKDPNIDWVFGNLMYENYKLKVGDFLIAEYDTKKKTFICFLVEYDDYPEAAVKEIKSLKRFLKTKADDDKFFKNIEILTRWSISKGVNLDLLFGTHKSLINTSEWWIEHKTTF